MALRQSDYFLKEEGEFSSRSFYGGGPRQTPPTLRFTTSVGEEEGVDEFDLDACKAPIIRD